MREKWWRQRRVLKVGGEIALAGERRSGNERGIRVAEEGENRGGKGSGGKES